MKQYCRYCGACHGIDVGLYYCNEKEKVMSESETKRVNHCKDYGYTTCGDVITGKQYQPKKTHKKHSEQLSQYEQMSLEV